MSPQAHHGHAPNVPAASSRLSRGGHDDRTVASRSPMLVTTIATLHCLTGCAIGEVLGMVIGTAFGLSDTLTIVLAITLAFLFGYTLTLLPLRRAGLALAVALPLALMSDTFSISVMEVVDNVAMVTIPGAMDASLTDRLFWAALAVALAVAFLAALPVNRYLIARGRGHALVHAWHHTSHERPQREHAPRIAMGRIGATAIAALALTIGIGILAATLAGAASSSGARDPKHVVRP